MHKHPCFLCSFCVPAEKEGDLDAHLISASFVPALVRVLLIRCGIKSSRLHIHHPGWVHSSPSLFSVSIPGNMQYAPQPCDLTQTLCAGRAATWQGKLYWKPPGSAPIWPAQAKAQQQPCWRLRQCWRCTSTARMAMLWQSSVHGPWVRQNAQSSRADLAHGCVLSLCALQPASALCVRTFGIWPHTVGFPQNKP